MKNVSLLGITKYVEIWFFKQKLSKGDKDIINQASDISK